MTQDQVLIAQRILIDRGFTAEPDNGLNVIQMSRQFGPDLSLLVWARNYGGLRIQLCNPSDYEGVCGIAETENHAELIMILDALITALHIVQRSVHAG